MKTLKIVSCITSRELISIEPKLVGVLTFIANVTIQLFKKSASPDEFVTELNSVTEKLFDTLDLSNLSWCLKKASDSERVDLGCLESDLDFDEELVLEVFLTTPIVLQ